MAVELLVAVVPELHVYVLHRLRPFRRNFRPTRSLPTRRLEPISDAQITPSSAIASTAGVRRARRSAYPARGQQHTRRPVHDAPIVQHHGITTSCVNAESGSELCTCIFKGRLNWVGHSLRPEDATRLALGQLTGAAAGASKPRP